MYAGSEKYLGGVVEGVSFEGLRARAGDGYAFFEARGHIPISVIGVV